MTSERVSRITSAHSPSLEERQKEEIRLLKDLVQSLRWEIYYLKHPQHPFSPISNPPVPSPQGLA